MFRESVLSFALNHKYLENLDKTLSFVQSQKYLEIKFSNSQNYEKCENKDKCLGPNIIWLFWNLKIKV